MKRILTVFACVLLSLTALAQSPNVMAMAQAELQKRGLNEQEVRARLLEEGIDVDAIPPTEYPAYQSRVMEILDKMQAEKSASRANSNVSVAAPAIAVGNDIVVDTTITTMTTSELPQTTLGEAAAEQALEKALEESGVDPNEGKDIYGHELFKGKSLEVYRTTDGAQAPDTYVLGEGDEVHISIFGSSQTEIHHRIAPDGSIQPAGSTKIFLKGMNLGQARNAVKAKLAQHYSFRPDQIAVTITTARTLTVSIYGEVGVQGGFTLSALNTAFNALVAAGGPSAIGSVRNIQRSRAGKTERLDLYKYMKGDIKNVLYDLQNNDVLFVPIAQKVVSISGAVRRPMRYEMVDGETLKDLIDYAGGLTDNVYPNFVQIERRENGEIKYLEYNLSQVVAGKEKVALASGDIIRIKAAGRPIENFVAINGDVYYGGNFDLEKNTSLKALIEKAEPRVSARKDYVFVERTSPDETVEVLTVPFPGENGNPDFKLQAKDVVTVLQMGTFQDSATISVGGEVREPFTRKFGLNDSMTLGQAIEYAGGPKYTARTDYVFVERTRPDETVEVLTVPFPGVDGNPDIKLQAKDIVTVLAQSNYRDTDTVSVAGQVRAPFSRVLGLNDRMTVNQAIEYAGGLKPSVYPVAYIFRKDITNPVKMQYLPINLDTEGDTLLQPGDQLNIYDNSTYTNIGEIRVSGAVKNAVRVTFDSAITVHDAIAMAGGFDVGAAYDKVEIFRVNLSKTDDITYKMITLTVDDEYNPTDPNFQLQPYDHIVVRRLPHFSGGRTVEINGRVRYPGVYVLEDSRIQLSKIIELAGGLLDDADPYATILRNFHGVGNIAINLNDVKRHKNNTKYDPILMDEDVVNISRMQNTVTIRETGTRMAQYIPAEFSSLQKHMVYQGRHSAKWYIDQFAGGTVRTADLRSITVTLPNYQSVGTKRFLGINIYPKVEPGSTITLTIDQNKKTKIEKPKEEIDWGRLAANTMSTLTSMVSMILLIERLN